MDAGVAESSLSVIVDDGVKEECPITCLMSVELRFCDLSFKPVTWEGSVKKEKLVLQNINSSITPGSLTGLVGPSGSGKTSLLHVVAGMVPSSQVQGQVLANGQVQQIPKRLVGFVFQDDLLLPRLTVHETLTIAARLKIPNTVSAAEKAATVETLIKELGLTKCKHAQVGVGGSSLTVTRARGALLDVISRHRATPTHRVAGWKTSNLYGRNDGALLGGGEEGLVRHPRRVTPGSRGRGRGKKAE
eukprot:818644-Prorocentrum_minimum.AAC.4